MLTREMIRLMVGNTIYNRGFAIYNGMKINDFIVNEDGMYYYAEAEVEGSNGNEYHVELMYDSEEEIMDDCSCDCRAFHTYAGVCKHCAAVMLELEEYLRRQQLIMSYASRKEKSLEKLRVLKGAYQKPKQAEQTTASIKQLLARRQSVKVLPILQDNIYGKIRIEPYLMFNMDSLLLEFRIGITHLYVLKDILAFTRLMENKENYSYGKKLEFVHIIEMFQPEAQPMVRFILDWSEQNRSQYIQYTSYGYNPTVFYQKVREIPLKGGMLETFFDIVKDQKILLTVQGDNTQLWSQTDESLKRKIEITGKEEGISVKIDNYPLIKGKNYIFYFYEGKIYRVQQKELEPVGDFLSSMERLPGHKAFIHNSDVPGFCRDLLPELKELCDCEITNFNIEDYGVIPAEFEIYLDSPQKDFITFKVFAVYGEQKYSLYGPSSDMSKRDAVKEAWVGQLISQYTNAYDKNNGQMVLAEDEDLLFELITSGIGKMQEAGEVFISESIKQMTVIPSPKVTLGVSLSGNLMELSMTSGDMSKDQLLEILTKYNKRKKFFRLKNGRFIDMQDEGLNALLELKNGLNLTDKQLSKDRIAIPKYRALYLDGELKEKKAVAAIKDKAFKSLIRNMKTVEDNDFEVPSSLDNILREYQKHGFLWLKTLKHNGFGGILADDMGLGKTLQVITLLESERLEAKEKAGRSLIVTPASLVFNWNSEIQRFAPGLKVIMVVGKAEDRQSLIQNAGSDEILLTSYDLLKRDSDYYKGVRFSNQIIDEAQSIKNYHTQAAKAVKEIEAGFKLALTGTPVENRLSELWSIFDYLMPGFLYSYTKFREQIEQRIVQNQDEAAMNRLQKIIRPFVLRRLKRDVLTDLPNKLEKNYIAELSGEQQLLYDAHVKRIKLMLDKQSDDEFKHSKIQILSELTRLRQICCNPELIYEDYKSESVKTQLCLDVIRNAIEGGHKILLFSQFTSMLDILRKRMTEEQISTYLLTGATSKEMRARLVEDFNKDDTQVFCISLKAGGTGMNLTSADIVIHYDPWWNQAVQTQATDRAHRIGQKNIVTVYKLIVKGTIEEKILNLQEKKRELADQILGGEGLSSGSFSREELLELLNI